MKQRKTLAKAKAQAKEKNIESQKKMIKRKPQPFAFIYSPNKAFKT